MIQPTGPAVNASIWSILAGRILLTPHAPGTPGTVGWNQDITAVAGAPGVAAAAPRGQPYSPDNFLLGANLPWVSYGSDFGANAWQPGGGMSNPARLARLDETLGKLAGQGIKEVRWFMLSDGRSGIRFGADGTPLGLDPHVLPDVDAALATARRHGIKIMFALVDFGLLKKAQVSGGVQGGGHADVICNPAKRQALLDNVFKPILQRYGHDPNIFAWDVINEPEWTTRWVASVNMWNSASRDQMRDFIGQTVDYIHRYTDQQATVGSASTLWLPLVQGLNLDFYQAHWYDHFNPIAPLDRPVAELQLDRPLILGEFPSKGTAKQPQEILETVRKAGYGGAMPWSVLATDGSSNYDGIQSGLADWANRHAGQLYRD